MGSAHVKRYIDFVLFHSSYRPSSLVAFHFQSLKRSNKCTFSGAAVENLLWVPLDITYGKEIGVTSYLDLKRVKIYHFEVFFHTLKS